MVQTRRQARESSDEGVNQTTSADVNKPPSQPKTSKRKGRNSRETSTLSQPDVDTHELSETEAVPKTRKYNTRRRSKLTDGDSSFLSQSSLNVGSSVADMETEPVVNGSLNVPLDSNETTPVVKRAAKKGRPAKFTSEATTFDESFAEVNQVPAADNENVTPVKKRVKKSGRKKKSNAKSASHLDSIIETSGEINNQSLTEIPEASASDLLTSPDMESRLNLSRAAKPTNFGFNNDVPAEPVDKNTSEVVPAKKAAKKSNKSIDLSIRRKRKKPFLLVESDEIDSSQPANIDVKSVQVDEATVTAEVSVNGEVVFEESIQVNEATVVTEVPAQSEPIDEISRDSLSIEQKVEVVSTQVDSEKSSVESAKVEGELESDKLAADETVVDEPVNEAAVDEPVEEAAVNKSVEEPVINEPTDESVVDEPTDEELIDEEPESHKTASNPSSPEPIFYNAMDTFPQPTRGNSTSTYGPQLISSDDQIESNNSDAHSSYYSAENSSQSSENLINLDEDERLEELFELAQQAVKSDAFDAPSSPKSQPRKLADPFSTTVQNHLYIQTGKLNSKDKNPTVHKLNLNKRVVHSDRDVIPDSASDLQTFASSNKVPKRAGEIEAVAQEMEAAKSKAITDLKVNRTLVTHPKSKAEVRKEKESTTGANWFNMPAPELTDEVKRDLQVLKLRNVLDPKRFYKKDNKKVQSKYFQFGTVIEDKSEFYSARLAKKDRKATMVDEILHDKDTQSYFKSKFNKLQDESIRNGRAPKLSKPTKNKHKRRN